MTLEDARDAQCKLNTYNLQTQSLWNRIVAVREKVSWLYKNSNKETLYNINFSTWCDFFLIKNQASATVATDSKILYSNWLRLYQ